MSYYDGSTSTYAFSLCINQGNRTIVDTTVEVPDTKEGITRAKRTISCGDVL